jgi:hypothetical protein
MITFSCEVVILITKKEFSKSKFKKVHVKRVLDGSTHLAPSCEV